MARARPRSCWWRPGCCRRSGANAGSTVTQDSEEQAAANRRVELDAGGSPGHDGARPDPNTGGARPPFRQTHALIATPASRLTIRILAQSSTPGPKIRTDAPIEVVLEGP